MRIMKLLISTDQTTKWIAYQYGEQNVFLGYKGWNVLPYLSDIFAIESTKKSIEAVYDENFNLNFYEEERVIGEMYDKVWKPGLDSNFPAQLSYTINEKNIAKRDLGILLGKVRELLQYVEPSTPSMTSFGYKMRELLILASTEVESYFKALTSPKSGHAQTTSDYVSLLTKVDTTKYEIGYVDCIQRYSCSPFKNWKVSAPTQSIAWYDAYNKVKHDKGSNMTKATLKNCLDAVAAAIILFSIRYSPHVLYLENDSCSMLFNNSFELRVRKLKLCDIYIPLIHCTRSHHGALCVNRPFKNGTVLKDILDIPNIHPLTSGR